MFDSQPAAQRVFFIHPQAPCQRNSIGRPGWRYYEPKLNFITYRMHTLFCEVCQIVFINGFAHFEIAVRIYYCKLMFSPPYGSKRLTLYNAVIQQQMSASGSSNNFASLYTYCNKEAAARLAQYGLHGNIWKQQQQLGWLFSPSSFSKYCSSLVRLHRWRRRRRRPHYATHAFRSPVIMHSFF
jgi:hypothetical protein